MENEELSEDALKLLDLLHRYENGEDESVIEGEINDIFPCFPFLKVCGDELIEAGEKVNRVKKLIGLHEYAKTHRSKPGEVCGKC